MGYDPYLGFEGYEHRKGIIKKELRPLILGIILLNIIISILLCYGIINRPHPTKIETFLDDMESEKYEPQDVVYVEIYAADIDEFDNYFIISDEEDDITWWGVINLGNRISLHNYFRDEIKIGETYICEVKIFKYVNEYHEPGEFSLGYRVREVYLESEFHDELGIYDPIVFSLIIILFGGSFFFITEFFKKKELSPFISKNIGYLLFFFTILLAVWALYVFINPKPTDEEFGVSLIIASIAKYMLIFTPIMAYFVFVEKGIVNLRNIKINLLLSILLGLMFCALSFFIYYILTLNFTQLIFRNETMFEFNRDNLPAYQLIAYFIFFFGVVAIVEEVVFRWFFAKRFVSYLGFDFGLLISAILFGIMHLPVGLFVHHFNIVELVPFIFLLRSFWNFSGIFLPKN